ASQQNLGIPQQTLTDLATAMTAQVTAESPNGTTGSVTWTVSLPDKDLDFLAQGETLSATYNVTVSDGNGGSAAEPVTPTFDGASDVPAAVGGVLAGAITEDSLVANGGFEAGGFGWVAAGNTGSTPLAPHSGTDAGFLVVGQGFGQSSSFSQTVQTVAGQSYL